MEIKEVMYYLFKDGKCDGHQVGFLYSDEKKFQEKFDRLQKDYPESKGYRLALNYKRTL